MRDAQAHIPAGARARSSTSYAASSSRCPVALGDLSLPGAPSADRAQAPQTPRATTTSAGSAPGPWSCGRWTSWAGCCLRRRHRAQGRHRHRRPLPVLRHRQAGGPGDRPAGVRRAARGLRTPRGPRADPDRQRQGLHRPVRPRSPPRCSSTGSAARTGSATCSPPPTRRPRPARSSGCTRRCARSSSPERQLRDDRARPRRRSTSGSSTTTTEREHQAFGDVAPDPSLRARPSRRRSR